MRYESRRGVSVRPYYGPERGAGRSQYFPPAQGLYDPRNEHDACGIGFVANLHGTKSHEIVEQALQILINLNHRGAVGADPSMGDGAGILIQMPHDLLRDTLCLRGPGRPRLVVRPCHLASLRSRSTAAHGAGAGRPRPPTVHRSAPTARRWTASLRDAVEAVGGRACSCTFPRR